MRFDGFYGNQDLKQRLGASFAQEKIAHCYLICGPEGAGKHTLARILSAAMQCTGAGERPCGVCAACRKAFSAQHPDIITVDDTEHKNVAVDVIRAARADVFVRPNEGQRKVYLIPRAQDMGDASQNALLKILEEPPAYAVFLLLSDHAEKLLPTIRSRCAELHLTPVGREEALAFLRSRHPDAPQSALESAYLRSGGFLGQALTLLDSGAAPQTADFAAAYASGDAFRLLQVLLPLEKYKRDVLIPVIQQWRALLSAALNAKSGMPAASDEAAALCQSRTGTQLLAAVGTMQQALDALSANVGVAAVIGWLSTQLR